MKKNIRSLIALSAMLLVTVATALLTKAPYGNAFFCNAKGLVISFLAFLAIDILRWITRLTLDNAAPQTKRQELGWTVGFLLFMTYFLWRSWRHYSWWQGWLTVAICAMSLVGLAVRLWVKWDADRVRWATWTVCCFAVTCSILGTILFWHPMTLKEAEALVIEETSDSSFTFRRIENGADMTNSYALEAPLGYYIFQQKQPDGSYGSYGTGRAVVYLGENQDAYRNPNPKE